MAKSKQLPWIEVASFFSKLPTEAKDPLKDIAIRENHATSGMYSVGLGHAKHLSLGVFKYSYRDLPSMSFIGDSDDVERSTNGPCT